MSRLADMRGVCGCAIASPRASPVITSPRASPVITSPKASAVIASPRASAVITNFNTDLDSGSVCNTCILMGLCATESRVTCLGLQSRWFSYREKLKATIQRGSVRLRRVYLLMCIFMRCWDVYAAMLTGIFIPKIPILRLLTLCIFLRRYKAVSA